MAVRFLHCPFTLTLLFFFSFFFGVLLLLGVGRAKSELMEYYTLEVLWGCVLELPLSSWAAEY
jgi:hypothetical protein